MAIHLSVRFANANTLSALTNTSVSPELIAASLNLDPGLFHYLSDSLHPPNAVNRLHAQYAKVARGVAAGYMEIALLLRVVNYTFLASNVFRQRVLAAREPPFLGVEGRVIRLCGRISDTLTMSLERDGRHLLPIIEDPAVYKHLLEKHTQNGQIPAAWQVREGQYGSPQAWAGLYVDEPALLKTQNGKRLLYIEADGTNSEDALRFGTESADLTIEDASAAFRMIEDRANHNPSLPPYEVVKVFLGDMLQKKQTGGGTEYTLRQRIKLRREVDIFVDSKLPIVTEIVSWCDRTADKGYLNRKVIFETDSQEYYHNCKEILQNYGFTVVDIVDVTPEEAGKLPRLIYYRRTASTVNAFRAVIESEDVDPSRLCVVIDTKEGLDTIRQLHPDETVRIVCSSEIYDGLLRQIRTWCRMGYTPSEIQREIDARSAYVRQIAKMVAEQTEEAKKAGELKKGEFEEDLQKKEKEEVKAKEGQEVKESGEGKPEG
ncbi:hypothetical protein HK097_008522 [Rhizophlyctis rosea]|uniref:Uncharacterized protein n=1 Tax=Rhizophlyctis rosea TaxID=64517 RepID=A0AAD5X3X1_9FUNG|nr:hypothetical protein HK097_008522 [Rhizophlyctis rosea]